jgi:hypothetical protein
MKSSRLFIYLFIYSHRQTCAEAAPATHACGGKPSLLSSPQQCILKCWFLSDFEQLCGTWIAVAKFIARSEVTTRRLPTNSWNIKYLLLQRDLNDGSSWPTWVHVGAWAPSLWYMFELIPFKAKLAVSNGFGSRTTKVFFFFFPMEKMIEKTC